MTTLPSKAANSSRHHRRHALASALSGTVMTSDSESARPAFVW